MTKLYFSPLCHLKKQTNKQTKTPNLLLSPKLPDSDSLCECSEITLLTHLQEYWPIKKAGTTKPKTTFFSTMITEGCVYSTTSYLIHLNSFNLNIITLFNRNTFLSLD